MRRHWPLALIGLLLVVADGYVRLTFGGRARIHAAPWSWFNAAAEWTIPTWFSVLVMFAAGIGCWRQAPPARGTWRLMGLLFCYLAIDDLMSLHEGFGALLHPFLSDVGVYVWVFTLGPVFAIVGLVCALRLLRALAQQPARRACLFLGFAALGIALVFEVFEDAAVRSAWQPRGIPLVCYTQWFEETLEAFGPVLLFAAVWVRPAPASAEVAAR